MVDVEIDTNVKDFTNRINFGIIVCTSGTRPTAVDGKTIYETDTDKLLIYNGATWAEITGGGVTDHGALTGLTDDDHTQYVLVDGTRAMTGNLNINGTDVQSGAIEVNIGGSGNRYAFVDLHGDDTFTDYGFRMIRFNTGLNAESRLTHRGTGSLKIECAESAEIKLRTLSVDRFTISSTALTSTVPLAMGTNKITGMAAATANGEAVRYEQLTGAYLPISGGTMSGDIVMGDNDITGADTLQATASQNLTLKVSTGSSIVFQAV